MKKGKTHEDCKCTGMTPKEQEVNAIESAPKVTCDDVVAAANEAHKGFDKLIKVGLTKFIDNARKISSLCTSSKPSH